jgi:hypothetical protein
MINKNFIFFFILFLFSVNLLVFSEEDNNGSTTPIPDPPPATTTPAAANPVPATNPAPAARTTAPATSPAPAARTTAPATSPAPAARTTAPATSSVINNAAEINAINSDISGIKGDIANINKDIADIQNQILDLNSKYVNIQNDIEHKNANTGSGSNIMNILFIILIVILLFIILFLIILLKTRKNDITNIRPNETRVIPPIQQTSLKTNVDIDNSSSFINNNQNVEEVTPKEQTTDEISSLFNSSKDKRDKWHNNNPSCVYLDISKNVLERLALGEKIELLLERSGNRFSAMFLLIDNKYLYPNFHIYNETNKLNLDKLKLLSMIYNVDNTATQCYIVGCTPSIVSLSSSNGCFQVRNKGRLQIKY